MTDRTPAATQWLLTDAAAVAMRMRARRDVALTDLFLPDEGRLRDDDRATIARLLAGLIDRVEHDLRTYLARAFMDRPMLAQSLASSRMPIAAPILVRTKALHDGAIVAALARRAEEGRLIARLRLARDRARALEPDADPSPTAELAAHSQPAVAAAALRLGEAARDGRDPSGAPILAAAELPAEAQHRLVWRIAAALRDYVVASHTVSPGALDPAIAAAANAVLAGYDEDETLGALALALARALHAADRLDDILMVRALAAGEPALAAAMLAVRGRIGFAGAWEMMTDPDAGRLLLLCRAAGVALPHAADLALRLADGADDDAMVERLGYYEVLAPHDAQEALALWRLDPALVDAIAALAGDCVR